MSVQINVQASQTALAQSIAQGVAAFNARYAGQNQLNLQINSKSFSQPLGRITSDLADFESALKASNARVLAFGASTAVLGGVTKAFKEIANVTLEVEKSLTDINRVLNLSTSGLQKFSSELFNVSKQTASSFDDASKAALEFSRQGLNTEETLKRTADALTLVRLTGISSTKAVEDLTATINGFSKAGLTTTQVVNKLAAVEQDFAVSAADLTEALSRTGQAAQEAGVDFDELNALVTTAQQNTARGGAVIGNALKTIFTRLQRTETLDQLEKFNIIVRDVQGNILPAVQILQNFANKYNDLADAQRAQLSEQVAGVYQVNILKGIITDLTGVQSTYSKALERGAQASNEADIANQKLNKTLSALAAQTGVGLQQLANNIGKVTFAPLFEAIVSPINDAVKYINDTLEGEGPGSIFANGLLKGIRNVIAGPGLAVTFAVIAKVAKNTFEDATKALPAILGLTTEAQKRANIEKSIIAILQTQSNLSLALQGQQGNATTQAATILNYAKLQTAQYQQQLQIAQQLAPLLAAQNVTVGARGIQVGPRIKAGGHIPAFAEMSERMGAAMGGYKAGKVVKAPRSVGGNTYMNSAEDVKYVSGFAQPFINPPANSKAGRKHRQNAINRTGVDPYALYAGFIPNFASKRPSQFDLGRDFENTVGLDIGVFPAYNAAIDFNKVINKPVEKNYNPRLYKANSFADAHAGYGHKSSENISKVINHLNENYYSYFPKQGLKTKRLKVDDKSSLISKPDLLGDLFIRPYYTEIVGAGSDEAAKIQTSTISSLNTTAQATLLNGVSDKDKRSILNKKIKMMFAQDRVYGNGFIPNFAPPTSAIRVPWFKKFANSAYDNIQPALGISRASDVDTFRQINFRSNAKGADKVGDSNIFAPLYEDFIFKALQLVSQPKIKDQLIRGYVNQPGTDQKQSAFDAFLGDVGLEFKGFPKGNLTGSISKNLNDKYERYAKANPTGAAKIKESIIAFNEIGDKNQLPSDFGKNFSQLAGTSYSEMVKNNPDLVKALSAETNMLLQRYIKDPAFLAVAAARGFIPNFAYKQSVMALEEGMSGKNAILDTTTGPFPFIRNSGQSNFASAISDHGGLKNALNDSMRNQEAAGLMNSGYIPNFAAPTIRSEQAFNLPFKALADSEQKLLIEINKIIKQIATTNLPKAEMDRLSAEAKNYAAALQSTTKSQEIILQTDKALAEATKRATNSQIAANNANDNRTSIFKKMYGPAAPTQNKYTASAPSTSSGIRGVLQGASNLTNKLSSNVGFQIAIPMIAGQVESAIAGNRDRSEMSFGRRFASTGASAALTGASTGALIGSIIPGFGTAIGAAVGAVAGLTGAFLNAKDTVNDFANSIQKANQKDKEGQDAVQGYVNSLKQLEQGGMSPKEQAKIEKEREKFFLRIPAQIKATLTGTENAMDVESKILDKMETDNINRTKARSLQELGGSDLTKENFDSIRQNIAELSLVDKRFANISRAIYTSKTGEERAAFLAKGGGLEEQLSKSELFKSLSKDEQTKIVAGFREAFGNTIQGTIRSSSLATSVEAARQSRESGKSQVGALPLVKKSATDIYLEIDKFLFDTSNQLRQTLAAEQFRDKFSELKTTFENSLVEGFIAPAKAISADTAMKKTMLQNTFNREIKTANDEFSQKFANEIRNTPVVGASPKVMSDLQSLLQKPGGATVQDFESFLPKLPLMQIPFETMQKINKMIQDQKNLEKDKKDTLTREQQIIDENARQLLIRQELAIFEANQASKISSQQSKTQRGLTTRQTTFDIQQAQSESYLGYQPNFYNMGMQQESELRIRYREASSQKSLALMKESQLTAAKTNILDAERLKIMAQIEAAQKAGKDEEVKRLQNIPLLKETNLDNLESLQKTINAQEVYFNSLKENDKEYASAQNALENLKNIQNDINEKVRLETELLKIRNEEDRRRVRDAKSFSVGLSAGFNTINQERETFRKDFGEKIPGLFRDGLVGAMDAALNKADDLESALMGVAASFLREIQGMMLRNIANNIVGSIGSAFSFGQPAAGVEPNFQQRGGIIRAQKGMYISGGRTGDKNPALLEDGEYVLNRNAVRALGGPKAIDNMNFNAFPRFATGGDPGTMSASADAGAAFERLSMFGREQSPEFQTYMDKIREEEAIKEKKRAERKALLNQFLGTLITTGISMGLSSAFNAAKESSMASANLKGATGTLADGTTTQVTSFADAKSLINSGGSVTLSNGSVINKSSFGTMGITKSSFNDISASRFAASGMSVKPGSMFGGKPSYNVQGTTTPYNALFPEYGTQINANFANPGSAYNFSRSIGNFQPRIPNVKIGRGRQEGGIIGLNQGGFLPYGSRLTDSIPAYLSGGEYVVNSRAVRKYGVGGLNRINSGVARFEDGGLVGSEGMSGSNTSNTSNSNIAINITVNATNGKSDNEQSDNNENGTEGNAKELSNRIKSVVLDVITNEQRTGGLLDSTKKK